jgi:hypothetical protein
MHIKLLEWVPPSCNFVRIMRDRGMSDCKVNINCNFTGGATAWPEELGGASVRTVGSTDGPEMACCVTLNAEQMDNIRVRIIDKRVHVLLGECELVVDVD